MSVTSDPSDPRLTHGPDTAPVEQADVYLVLSEEERAKGFTRPLYHTYQHNQCSAEPTPFRARTMMAQPIAETYARDPKFYGGTYCMHCKMHRPVAEFTWVTGGVDTGIVVGS